MVPNHFVLFDFGVFATSSRALFMPTTCWLMWIPSTIHLYEGGSFTKDKLLICHHGVRQISINVWSNIYFGAGSVATLFDICFRSLIDPHLLILAIWTNHWTFLRSRLVRWPLRSYPLLLKSREWKHCSSCSQVLRLCDWNDSSGHHRGSLGCRTSCWITLVRPTVCGSEKKDSEVYPKMIQLDEALSFINHQLQVATGVFTTKKPL